MSKFKIISDVNRIMKSNDLCFAFFKGSILVRRENNNTYIPTFEEIESFKIKCDREVFLGEIEGVACFGMEILSKVGLPKSIEFLNLRELMSLMKEEVFLAAGRASEILSWNGKHKFCGNCGERTEDKKDEIAKVCPNCNNVIYPVICPAVIVGIVKEDKILLAHNSNFKNNMYALISGFVESGENLENAVRREIFEEVGIKVKNIRYFNSSAWPFPNSLMLGFFAEYESGEIKVDGEEITAANWFCKDEFPDIPGRGTIARRIIDKFIEQV
ncbi:NAD(+) diphosphatase [Clostridium felsineum]|uniref:NAD(+) diphosphatase n=1 Tax=Clostridium felsineum TaxID=36839 RepID=UPI00098CDA54|nr:NAD(+) diphosphatase [Clostridium felsineum]URZ14484.1 NADH pyrophosphatase [Clostridium felsineum DSM 794]